ncbi:Rid family hydrolase [Alteromonas gilva]|uniref:Rid family hydrolase n=1 Tax=Alteromonas gilva TaxID=2987522 RepID=A0ABT5KZQ0_9ALTE|nr:Rid family hydrolase [Alteromonas gilva]MDC8830254.1 Rid family hydrolase [Alteromonas gilva]
MTNIIKVKTGNKLEEEASYSRLVAVDDWVFVSNTAGRNPLTKEIPDDILAQTDQVFANVERALSTVDATLADVIRSRVFIHDATDVPAVMRHIGKKFKGINPVTTVTCPPMAGASYKVELEVTAYRNASKANIQEISTSLT